MAKKTTKPKKKSKNDPDSQFAKMLKENARIEDDGHIFREASKG